MACSKTDGVELDGRRMKVNEAQPKNSSQGRFGGGYGGGYRVEDMMVVDTEWTFNVYMKPLE